MEKDREHFAGCLSRDWVVSKIENIAGTGKQLLDDDDEQNVDEDDDNGAVGGHIPSSSPTEKQETSMESADNTAEVTDSKSDDKSKSDEVKFFPEATSIVQKLIYSWCGKWTIVRGRDAMYLWSDSVAIELSNGSNGWFRYILNGTLSTMYSSGSPEGGSEGNGKAFSLWHEILHKFE